MAGKSDDLTDAVVLDLKDITVGNGFRTNMVKVDRGIVLEISKATPPHVAVTWGGVGGGGFDTSAVELTANLGTGVHRIGFRTVVNGPDADGLLHQVMDDIRNAIERANSHVNAVLAVIDATVLSGAPFHTAEDLANGYAAAEGNIEIRYEYERGEL